jgi:16S rRNA U516 pseudouridylate synthase RsuA-like enzyme
VTKYIDGKLIREKTDKSVYLSSNPSESNAPQMMFVTTLLITFTKRIFPIGRLDKASEDWFS